MAQEIILDIFSFLNNNFEIHLISEKSVNFSKYGVSYSAEEHSNVQTQFEQFKSVN